MTWDRIVDIFSSGIDKIVSDNFENIKKILDAIGDWLTDPEVIAGFKHVFEEMRKFFEDKENRAAFIRDIYLIGDAIKGVIWLVGKLIEGFAWLSKNVGPEWATAIAAGLLLFGPAIAAALLKGIMIDIPIALVKWLFGPLIAGATPAGTAIGAALRLAIFRASLWAAAAAGAWQAWKTTSDPHSRDKSYSEDNPLYKGHPNVGAAFKWTDPFYLLGRMFQGLGGVGGGKATHEGQPEEAAGFQHGGIVNINAHDGEMVLPRNISEGLQQMFGPHPDNLLSESGGRSGINFETIFIEFQRWWSGDASFRPLVDLADRFYDKMSELLINVLDQTLKAMGYKDGIYGAAGTPGASPGVAPAPGSAPPGTPGTPGSPTGAPAGGVEFPPDWKPPETTQTTSSGMEISHPERNNPGNLRVGGGDWLGKTTRPGQAFESFDTMAHGIRARIITYNSYFKRGLDTIAKIAEASGPGFENNMKAQLEAYKTAMGGDYNKPGGENLPIQLTPENLRKLTIAGLSFEHGGKGVKLPKGAGEKEINEVFLELAKERASQASPAGVPTPGSNKVDASVAERTGVNKLLTEAMVQGYKETLPEGWSAKVTPEGGYRPGGGWHGQHQAEDWQVYDKDGKPIANKAGTGPNAVPYRQAYIHAMAYLIKTGHQELAARMGSGLHFGTQRPRGGPRDQMHVDFGGIRASAGFGDPWEEYREALRLSKQQQQKVSEVQGTKLGAGGSGGGAANKQVAMNTTNNYYINGSGDPHQTQKLIDESHKRRGHEEQRNSRAFLA
jgi:hypothetical protein